MMVEKQIALQYKDHRSDKVYYLTMERSNNGWTVHARFGPRGKNLTYVDKTQGQQVTYSAALKIFDDTEREKRNKGYVDIYPGIVPPSLSTLINDLQYQTGIGSYELTKQQWERLAKYVLAYAEAVA